MPKLSRQIGTTSQLVDVFIQASNVTTGAGLTGLVFGTSGLTAYYHRNTANASVAISLATMTLGTWSTGGFIVVDGMNMPGLYQLGIPNAALVTGADSVVIYLQGAANMVAVVLEIELTAVNNQSTAYGLSIAKTTNITGFNDIAATAVVSSGAITTSGGAVSTVTTVGTLTTYTGNTVQTGDSYVRLGAPSGASVSADIAAVKSDTGTILADVNSGAGAIYNRLGAPAGASLAADIASVKTSVGSVTGAVGSVTGNVSGNVAGNVAGSVGSISGVTFPTHFSALAIDGSGLVTFNNVAIATATTVTNPVTLSLTQTLNVARDVDAIADTALTVNDALQCAVASVSAQVDASGGTTCTWKTASTGTLLRTKTVTNVTPPTTVPSKAI